MNHIYRIVFNRQTGTYQAVSEIARSTSSGGGATVVNRQKQSKSFIKRLTLNPLTLALLPLQFIAQAYAAPTGGQVVAGTANIAQTGNITDIHQSSQNAAINWQDFSIKATETVNFHQPNREAVTLNRVLGNEKSVIDGMMNASGKVFIQNPNGTLIGKNAQINVGGLVATTAKISDDDFMRGDYRFKHGTTGDITNLGQITVPKGGVVALIAPIVKNQGTITAHEANVLLASADSFSITLPDNANFAYTLDKGTLQGLVDNGGAILADGGRVVLTTLGIDTVKKSIIKHTGVIEANSVQNNNGVIELLGDLDNSKLVLAGTLKAEGQGTDNGGFIETSGAKLDIKDTAHVSTKSENGKTGTWRIDPKDFSVAPTGGDITGQQVSQNLQNNNVQLKSKSGAKDGKGDVIINDEISWDKNTLTLTADNDIHINKTLNGTGTAKLALEYGQATAKGTIDVNNNGQRKTLHSNYYLDKDTPLKNRTVKINLPEGDDNFSIKKGNGGTTEIFEVFHEMPEPSKDRDGKWIDAFLTDRIALGADIDVSYTKDPRFEGFAGWRLSDNASKVHGLGHKVDGLHLRGTEENKPVGLFQSNGQNGEFRDIGVTNVDILSQGRQSEVGALVGRGNNVMSSYATGKVESSGYQNHAGGLVGRGSHIAGSYADVAVATSYSHANAGGLVGWGEHITDSYATGDVLTKSSNSYAGGLAGHGDNISGSHATGNVSTKGSGAYAGGLAGVGKRISDSYATGKVMTEREYAHAGGLVGNEAYNIVNSYATGNVSVQGNLAYAGGLVGQGGNIHKSYATGSVSTSGNRAYAGGLLGYQNSGGYAYSIFDNHATGNVSTSGENAVAGGLIGVGNGFIKNNYALGSVTTSGKYAHAGGLLGNGSGIENSYAKGSVSTSGEEAFAGGLVGFGSDVKNSYTESPVITSGVRADAGGLIGRGNKIINSYANNVVNVTGTQSIMGGVIGYYDKPVDSNNSFFNKSKYSNNPRAFADQANNVNVPKINRHLKAKTDAQLKEQSTFVDWDFDKIWEISEGSDYPRLRGLAGQNTAPAPTPTPTPPSSGGTTPPSSGGTTPPSSGGTTPPSSGGTTPTPPSSGGTTPPSSGGTTPTPPSSGGTTPPSSGGTTPPSSGGTTPPSSGGTTPTPPSSGGTTPTPPSSGGTTPPSSGGTTPTPPSSGGTTPTPTPPSSGGTTPPSSGGTTPPSSGGTTPPSSGGTTPTPPSSGGTTPPSSGGTTPTPPSSGGTTPPSSGGKNVSIAKKANKIANAVIRQEKNVDSFVHEFSRTERSGQSQYIVGNDSLQSLMAKHYPIGGIALGADIDDNVVGLLKWHLPLSSYDDFPNSSIRAVDNLRMIYMAYERGYLSYQEAKHYFSVVKDSYVEALNRKYQSANGVASKDHIQKLIQQWQSLGFDTWLQTKGRVTADMSVGWN